MTLLEQYFNLTAVGLIYDIIGVFLVGRAIVANSLLSISAQSKTYWSPNYALRRALVEQRVDAFFGLPVLMFGFVLQLAGISRKSESFVTIAVWLGLLFIVVIGYVSCREKIVQLIAQGIQALEEKRKQAAAVRASVR